LPSSECPAPRRAPVLYVWGNAMAERADAVRKASKSAIPAQTATDAAESKADQVRAAAKPRSTKATSATVAKKAPAKKAAAKKSA
jgi:hypothetical protein